MRSPAYCHVETPIGRLRLVAEDTDLVELFIEDHPRTPALDDDAVVATGGGALEDGRRQLDDYFAGHRTTFELPLRPHGTAFQQSVWTALREIPYGQTVSYRDIAVRIGRPTSTRAVGAANGRNPLSIIVPCHRVIGADGGLTGYGWGLERKAWLLDHEQGNRQHHPPSDRS